MKAKKIINSIFIIILFSSSVIFAQPPAPPNIPRISPLAIRALIKNQKIKYIFIDASTFGDSHICGAIFISYTWLPKYGTPKIKKIKIPKNYYIFVY